MDSSPTMFIRNIVDWAMDGCLHTELVLAPLEWPCSNDTRPRLDQGFRYTSFAFGERCR